MFTLVLNSPWVDLEFLRRLAAESILIGIDGGLKYIAEAGIDPHWAIGDFDSVEPGLLESLSVKKIRFPKDKNHTDLELTLRLLRQFRPRRINILGLGGGTRFDHQLVNSVLLNKFALSGCVIRAWGQQWQLIFSSVSQVLSHQEGRYFSVFALAGQAVYCLQGAKYPAQDLIIEPGSGYGLGNQFSSRNVLVRVKKGGVVISQWHNT